MQKRFIIKWIAFPVLTLLISGAKRKDGLQLRTLYGSTATCNHITKDIFTVWWDKNYDYRDGAEIVLNSLMETRRICLDTFKMKDPKGSDNFYYNVYIHNNGLDLFPDDWAQAQSTDEEGYPYLQIPAKTAIKSYHGYVHEGFHIYQYNANSPGFHYRGDSQWFIEATANWFVNTRYPKDTDGFLTGQVVTKNPQLPMWYSFQNKKPGDKNNWSRDCHQYGMNIYLYYLTEVCKVPRYLIAHSFYDSASLSPQAYLSNQLGAETMNNYYANWAIHSTVGFDYLTAGQVARLKKEYQHYADPDDDHGIVKAFNNTGSNGWITVPDSIAPAAWAYNVYEIDNSSSGSYTISVKADDHGSMGAPSKFTVRAAVSKADNSNDFYSMKLPDGKSGKITLKVSPGNSKIWIVIASTPDHFSGNQTFSYKVKIDRAK